MKRAMIATPRIGSGTTIDPYRSSLTIAESWSDVTAQPVANIIAAQFPFTVEAILEDAALVTIEADVNYIVLWSVDINAEIQTPTDLDASGITALKAKIENLYYSDISALVTETAVNPVDITDELIAMQLRPPWQAGINVLAGEVYQYSGNLYEVIQPHMTQADWTPDIAHSLFKRFYEPSDDPWPWVQPQGAHDAYPLNARVLHNGFTWQSEIVANVWEPGSAGAEALWTNLTPPPPTSEWVSGEQGIVIGDLRTYQGITYECIQNPGINIWTPPTVPALWRVVP